MGTARVTDPVFDQKIGSGTSNEGIFLKFYSMNILDNSKRLLFLYILLVSDIPLILDPQNMLRFGSRAVGLTEVTRSIKTKKEALKII